MEQQDHLSQMRINQNIRNIHNRRRTASQLYTGRIGGKSKLFDAESVQKRRKRLEQIEQQSRMLEHKMASSTIF